MIESLAILKLRWNSQWYAARREFTEETGLQAEITALLDISEVVLPERPYHSITVTCLGKVTGGELRNEVHPLYGSKMPQWFSWQALKNTAYHPAPTIKKAFEYIR